MGALVAAIKTALRFRNFYLLAVGMTLTYFTFNYSKLGTSMEIVLGYGMIYLISVISMIIWGADFERFGLTKYDALTGEAVQKDYQGLWAVIAGGLAMLGTLIAMMVVSWARGTFPAPYEGPSGVGTEALRQLLLVALIETVVFVGLIPSILEKALSAVDANTRTTLVYVVSCGAFGLMHMTAYGGNWGSMLTIAGVGTVWLFLGRRYGLMAPWLSHFIYNCWVIGMLVPHGG
jgi:membrane protease YdiL (CAAX protease family)